MAKPPDADPDFLKKLTDNICGGLADARSDGGAAGDAHREERAKGHTPLYTGITPPALNDDGSLADPEAGPPKPPAEKQKTKKSKKSKKSKP